MKSRIDFYIGAFLVAVVLVLVGITVYTFWPWHVQIAVSSTITLLLIGLGFVSLRALMAWQHHVVDIETKRNQGKVLHSTDNGFGFIHDGVIGGYSHTAFDPGAALPELPEAFEESEGETGLSVVYPTSFGELVQEGYVVPGGDLVMGFEETGDPIRIKDLTSLGIGGGQNSGKTVTTLLLLLEIIAKFNGRVRFLVVDPHMWVDGEDSLVAKIKPLLPFFLTVEDVRATVQDNDHEYHALLDRLSLLSNPTEGKEELRGWMEVVRLEMERRLHGKKGELWVIVMDEFAAIMTDDTVAKPVAFMLEQLNQQARKMHMFAVLVSQEWKATRTGGSELRHSVVSFIAHNMPESISSLVLPTDIARKTVELDQGEVIIYSRGKARRGRVPYADARDAEGIVALYDLRPMLRISEVKGASLAIDGEAVTIPTPIRLQDVPEQPPELSLPEPRGDDGVDPAESEQIRAYFIAGYSETEIARLVYPVTSRRAVEKARDKVRNHLVYLIGGGHA